MAARIINATSLTIRGTAEQIHAMLDLLASEAAVINTGPVRFEVLAKAETDRPAAEIQTQPQPARRKR